MQLTSKHKHKRRIYWDVGQNVKELLIEKINKRTLSDVLGSSLKFNIS